MREAIHVSWILVQHLKMSIFRESEDCLVTSLIASLLMQLITFPSEKWRGSTIKLKLYDDWYTGCQMMNTSSSDCLTRAGRILFIMPQPIRFVILAEVSGKIV